MLASASQNKIVLGAHLEHPSRVLSGLPINLCPVLILSLVTIPDFRCGMTEIKLLEILSLFQSWRRAKVQVVLQMLGTINRLGSN